ncbi:MAG: rRNA maturation RNase YbeY [Candidatus Latescibacterota bacterium]
MPVLLGPSLGTLTDGQVHTLRLLAGKVVAEHPSAGVVEVILADDALLRRLNGAYGGRARATDVLSFDLRPTPAPAPDGQVCGEVYISVERARAQADEQGVALVEEVGRLLTHGLLHLAGYEHNTPGALQEMEGETDRLLQGAGLLATPR